jgi:RNA polymerase sigma-70 factor (ECF subfamily)
MLPMFSIKANPPRGGDAMPKDLCLVEVAWLPKGRCMQARNDGALASGGPPPARSVSEGGARGCYSRLADEDLISLVGAGDALAFPTLYERHAPATRSLARRLTVNEQDAEDLVQDSFLKVWRSAGSYRAQRGSARKWIFSVLRNRSIDLLRSRTSRRRALQKAGASSEPSLPVEEAFAPVWREFLRDRVYEALGELPHTQRTVLTLAHFSGLTHAQIAERLCVPLDTVKGRMRLGIEKLRGRTTLMAVRLSGE